MKKLEILNSYRIKKAIINETALSSFPFKTYVYKSILQYTQIF
jgi:hypothetical protein